MFFRHLFTRSARPSWRIAARGKKDLPIWRPPSFSDFFRRPSFFDDPWFRDFGGPFGPRAMDDFFREHMRRMDAMFKSSPWRMMEDFEPGVRGKSADIIQAKFGKDGLYLEMRMTPFDPDEIAVKMSGQRLVISAKHSSTQDDHGFVAREFKREFLIPEEIDTETFNCRFTDERHLIVSAKAKGEPETSRDIKIEREPSEEKEFTDQTKDEK